MQPNQYQNPVNRYNQPNPNAPQYPRPQTQPPQHMGGVGQQNP